ncbi:restriction endonuclease subunit S [Aquimarina agarivorans]|uniref:restriction endonuclease subunit S n=1 Tax=Aquimarina agarivorans TaxID=980584 RepID=UPI000248FC40|nr:restriction endonuclease subunit S [Aquimarina agarivorans]
MVVENNYISILTKNLPKHWESFRIGSVFVERTEKVSDKDFAPLSVTMKGIVPQLDTIAKTNNGDSRKKVCLNDFVINSRSDRKGSGGMSKYEGSVSLINTVLKPNDKYENRYTNYLFTNVLFQEEFYKFGKGIVDDMWSTKYFDMKYIKVPCPPIEEQITIANHLDSQSKKIKHFIKKKQTFIALLKEQRQAVINKAVTKGINPNVTLKNSGIDWLGNIPEHWEVIKLVGLCHFVRGNSTFKKDELLNNGKYVALQYGKTYKVDEIDENYYFYVNEEFYKSTQTIKFGDVIVVSTSETIEDLGHSVFYNRNDIGLLGGEQIALKPYHQNIDNKYLYYSAKLFTKTLQIYATGVKVFRFNINHLKTIYTSLPPKEEQVQIVSHIKTETAKIDKAITQAQKEIELIKEYKEAMIAEAVLGKLNHKIMGNRSEIPNSSPQNSSNVLHNGAN